MATTLLCPGSPCVRALRHTIASSVLATPHSHKWLDGVSDALTDFLRRLRETYPSATAKIRPGPTPTADYRPSRRSPWPAAKVLLGLRAKGLAPLGGVNAGEANLVAGVVSSEEVESVAVDDLEHRAGEGVGRGGDAEGQ